MASELVYLRDLDGTGSMHVCASGDDGAIAYAPAATRPAPEYAGLVSWLTYESREAARKNYPEFSQKLNEAATALTALTERNKALEAEVSRKDAALRTLSGSAQCLLQLAIDGGLADDLLAQVFPDATRKNGQPADEFAKRARRAVNELRAALSATAALGDRP